MLDFGPARPVRSVTIGLDLGHMNDHAAAVVLERDGEKQVVRQVVRFPLGTAFGDVVGRVHGMASNREVAGRVTLVVDATGLGAPVVEMIRRAGVPAVLVPVVITGGASGSVVGGTHHVPKRELVSALYLLFDRGAAVVPRGLDGLGALTEELLAFHANLSDEGRASYGACREGVHDDLVMALALAAWWARPRGAVGPVGRGLF